MCLSCLKSNDIFLFQLYIISDKLPPDIYVCGSSFSGLLHIHFELVFAIGLYTLFLVEIPLTKPNIRGLSKDLSMV